MIWAITFSNQNYKRSAKLNEISAKVFGGADKTIIYSPNDFDEKFVESNKSLLAEKRGAGYWAWKPYIIKKTLEKCKEGDYVMYLDAGAFYVRKIKHLINNMENVGETVFLSSMILPNKDWCKRDAFVKCGCDETACIYGHQVEASYILVKKNIRTMSFLDRWQKYCLDWQVNTDQDNILGKENYNGFRENRHDQTALSLAAYREGIIPHRGFSDSSEYRIYKKRLDEWGCWGYSESELQQLAYEEYSSCGFKESTYKRIIVNCRARNQKMLPFLNVVFNSIKIAIEVDMIGESDIYYITDKSSVGGGEVRTYHVLAA